MRSLRLLLAAALAAGPVHAQSSWVIAAPSAVARLGTFADSTLSESSAAVASRSQPGVIWTLNDSGNPPWLYAVDSAGRDLGIFRVSGADNFDWESLTLSNCPAGQCLVIGDLGDNPENRPFVRLYRIPEPTVTPLAGAALQATAPVESLSVRYPDGPHDVEALYADAGGDLFLITKGRTRGILLFRIPASAWSTGGMTVPERVDSLPITPDISFGQWVTDAALSPDGHRLAVRTYSAIFFFTVGAGGRLTPDAGRECFFGPLEPQGEGVTFLDERRLLLTSESSATSRGTLTLLDCGPPR